MALTLLKTSMKFTCSAGSAQCHLVGPQCSAAIKIPPHVFLVKTLTFLHLTTSTLMVQAAEGRGDGPQAPAPEAGSGRWDGSVRTGANVTASLPALKIRVEVKLLVLMNHSSSCVSNTRAVCHGHPQTGVTAANDEVRILTSNMLLKQQKTNASRSCVRVWLQELTLPLRRAALNSSPGQQAADGGTHRLRPGAALRPASVPPPLGHFATSLKMFVGLQAWTAGRRAGSHAFWESDVTPADRHTRTHRRAR